MHMTCSQCRYEFCWLCLGDYRNHSAETGRGLCNSFEDVVASGRGKAEDQEEKMKLDMMLRKLDHYKTRFTEHFRAIEFSKKKKQEIITQIRNCIELNHKYGPNDFKFLEEIAELVVRARRALTYTYAMRFYLESKSKQVFFDFIQGDLEGSLEKLNKKNEEEWQHHLDVDSYGSIHLGDRFFKYKQDVNTLKEAVEHHFSKVIN